MTASSHPDEHVLVWALGRDGPLTCEVLTEAGFGCRACADAEDLCREAGEGAGAVIVAAELLSADVTAYLAAVLARQPAWSDLPVIVVADGEAPAEGVAPPFDALGNVSVLGRPLSVSTLTSTIRAALRARRRQYQVRDLLAQREEADRRKDEFLAMLAHELRNPLAPVRSATEVLRMTCGDDPAVTRVGEEPKAVPVAVKGA